MFLGILAACDNGEEKPIETTVPDETQQTEQNSETVTDSESTTQVGSTIETDEESETTTQVESTTETDEESETKNENVIANEHDSLIQSSNALAGGVQAYFTDSSRVYFTVENREMTMNYARNKQVKQLVESIKNTEGVSYVQNTMDVFVRMTDGGTYYASNSTKSAEANLLRLGYYYYEALFEYQNFVLEDFEIENEKQINLSKQVSGNSGMKKTVDKQTGGMVFTIADDKDPQFIYSKDFGYAAESCTGLVFKAKAFGDTNLLCIYVNMGKGFNESQKLVVELIDDGEYHTYYVLLSSIPNFEGSLDALRFDPNGSVGDGVAMESMSLGNASVGSIPSALSINRHFHIYSDKMHHAIQFAVTERTENISEVGMLTEIDADTVSKLVVVTSDGKTYDSLSGFDWNDVVAVGFDIKNAGIFGYILPKDEVAGKLKVEYADGAYVIEQTRTPVVDGVSGVIIPSIDTEKRDQNGNLMHAEGVVNNGNDFYLGQRVYTDESHDFAEFLKETDLERNPLDEKQIKISYEESDGAAFEGYDAMRGIYVFKIATPMGFNAPYYKEPNKNYGVKFAICSDTDRPIYVMTSGASGNLECAVLMDENMMLLPVPVEVIKNFSEVKGERNLYNISDPTFSEAILYIPLKEGEEQEYTILNLYQNWGKYPLKQFSAVCFQTPYYHISTGVIETNCILPWFQTDIADKINGNTLPDFRSMSAPLWSSQPQHNSCGSHTWLAYSDGEGGEIYVECNDNNITSFGPTYAEMVWENISDDGKIKVTYTHMEMPQTDENRTYYTMEYEFLENLTIENFKENFRFYNITDYNATGTYKKIGYLNENNQCTVVDSNQDENIVPEYVLGDNCPYFSFFMMPDWDRENTGAEGYANPAFLICDSRFIVGGEKQDYSFLIRNKKDNVSLTLNIADTVNFKAGDKITINAILLPWGSQQYEDDPANRFSGDHVADYTDVTYSTVLEDGTLYMDKNVRDVRENSILNPFKVTSETDEIIESIYLPKVKSKDGKTAVFTLSGGENNVTVRVYGFYRLTAPKVEEYVGGEWQEYVLSSHETPDKQGNYHYYDGYMVHYDEDGSYSYSFVTTMHDGEPRKFRISADEEFKGWPEEEKPIESEGPLKVYVDPDNILECLNNSNMFGNSAKVEDENDGIYTSAFVKLDNLYKESYATFYQATTDTYVSGQYLVIKYRVPETNEEDIGLMEIFTSTETGSAVESGSFKHRLASDGKWHVDVIDLSNAGLKKFSPNEAEEYSVRFLRIDAYNGVFENEDTHIDFAYFGIDSDLSLICELERENFEYLNYYEGDKMVELDTATAMPKVDTYLDPASGYTESEEPFGALIGIANDVTINVPAMSKNDGIAKIFGTKANSEGKIEMSGWCGVNGGVEGYVYSVDGGKTWISCGGTPILANDDIIAAAESYAGVCFADAEESKVNGCFQGGGRIHIDLSEYAGQTLDVVMAAIPKANAQTLVLLYCFEDVACTLE